MQGSVFALAGGSKYVVLQVIVTPLVGGSKLSDGAARAVVALVVQHALDFPFGIMWSFVRFM